MPKCLDASGNQASYDVDGGMIVVTAANGATQTFPLDQFLAHYQVPSNRQVSAVSFPNVKMASLGPDGMLAFNADDGSIVYVPYWR